ncbi:MAG: glycosyltransferase family 4 protein [Terracidiphilus sp.]|jgi:glycosyltransferase involved in cell wall biosynthesis
MLAFDARQLVVNPPDKSASLPHIVVGITSPQTCLVLTGRLRRLREAGFRVTLVSGPGELLKRTALDEGVDAVALPMERGIAPITDLLSLLGLWRLLRRLKPDITEFSTPKAGLLGTVAARLSGVPVRVYMLRGLKLETSSGFKRRVLVAAERLAAACAHVVLCNSASLRAEALSLGLAPESKLRLLGSGSSNGVDAERFSPGPSGVRSKLGLPPDGHVLGFVGRLTRDKGLPELIDAFDLLLQEEPETSLMLVGWFDAAEDGLDAELRARIESHPRIVCTGFVSDTAPYYRAMDLMILPTWREGFPNAALEAAATGIPVITTLSTGACDAVLPEVTGLLIPPGYPEAICEAALKLLRDPKRRWRMGIAARAWVREHFVTARVLGLTVAFYTNLLKPAGTGEVSSEAAMDSAVPLQ